MPNIPTAHINLHAIIANWNRLRARNANATVSAVVKADAYGLGMAKVAPALAEAGCRVFCVATLAEGQALRALLAQPVIYVLQGLLAGEAVAYHAAQLRPVLNTVEQLENWQQEAKQQTVLPAAIHVDTAMERLGLSLEQLQDSHVLELARNVPADLLMTHYACASEYANPVNARQLERISEASRLLPHLPTSYANSAAHFLPQRFHGDVTRPGCALYGINPGDAPDSVMQPVVRLSAPILQHRIITSSGTISYGATARVEEGMRTATIALGYADGIHRRSSNQLYGYIADYRVPLLGRVTMDMLCFDVSAVPTDIVEREGEIVLMDHRQTVNDLAGIYGTIGYEVLTSLGNRIERVYQEWEPWQKSL